MGTILLILLLVLLFGGIPVTGYHYGWGASVSLGFVLLVFLVLLIANNRRPPSI